MSAPPFSATERFLDPGISRIYAVPAIVSTAAPTRPELDAGTDITGEVAAIENFALVSDTVDARAAESDFIAAESGPLHTPGTPRMAVYADEEGYDLRRMWDRGDTWFIVLLHGGDRAGNLMDVWPTTIAAVSKTFATVDAAFVSVQFTVHDDPVTDVEVP